MNAAENYNCVQSAMEQFYDCHMQGNCDIRNLFF